MRFISVLFLRAVARMLHCMAHEDTFTLTGDYENRVLEALKVAQHQARLAQAGAAPRMQDALVGLEDALSDQIAWLENAADADEADAEESGEPSASGRAGVR